MCKNNVLDTKVAAYMGEPNKALWLHIFKSAHRYRNMFTVTHAHMHTQRHSETNMHTHTHRPAV